MLVKSLFALVIAYILQFIARQLIHMGVFKHVYHHQPGPCRIVPGIEHGSEDAQVSSDGKLFVTSGLGHLTDRDDPHFAHMKGQIFLVDTKVKEPKAEALEIRGGLNLEDFHPHGLHLWENQGKLYLYVASHTRKCDTVEKFLYDGKENVLLHLSTFSGGALRMINDLVIVGPDQFYITNFYYSRSTLGLKMEAFLSLKWGTVAYFDGRDSKTVLDGFVSPNGINISSDGRYLYLAVLGPGPQGVRSYIIEPDRNLTLHKVIAVHTGLDNLDVHKETGDIFTGCHPLGYRLINYLQNPTSGTPPSQVLRIKMQDGDATDVEEIYAEDGHMVYGSSVAVYVNKRLFVGTVYHRLLQCDVMYMT